MAELFIRVKKKKITQMFNYEIPVIDTMSIRR